MLSCYYSLKIHCSNDNDMEMQSINTDNASRTQPSDTDTASVNEEEMLNDNIIGMHGDREQTTHGRKQMRNETKLEEQYE